eukprot:TRINITY_DN18903_c0_g1_i1.p1 TRINITY_DN18903_c0_g1~~TRINITY_DN18903_c0_g1_i1.p1  ORF type:complete len:701 (-),score=116.34 TRINITY_DN18903_c0_g1_i1:98-2200(-)
MAGVAEPENHALAQEVPATEDRLGVPSPRFVVPRSPGAASDGASRSPSSPTLLTSVAMGGTRWPTSGSGRATPGDNASRHAELVEARLNAQLARVRESHAAELSKSERASQVAMQRMDKKLLAHEGQHARIDRRVSELYGGFKGISDEMQDQIRRADAVDARLSEFRHEIEEEIRKKMVDFDGKLDEAMSKCRVRLASNEEVCKKLEAAMRRLEARGDQDTRLDMVAAEVHGRIDQLDEAYQQHHETVAQLLIAQPMAGCASGGGRVTPPLVAASQLGDVENKVQELAHAVDMLRNKALGDEGWDARLQEHDVRIQGLRVKVESLDRHYANFSDRVRQDWESRIDHVHKSLQESHKKHADHAEHLQGLHQRSAHVEQAVEQLRDGRCADTSQLGPVGSTRLAQIEFRLDELEADVAKQFRFAYGGALHEIKEDIKTLCREPSPGRQNGATHEAARPAHGEHHDLVHDLQHKQVTVTVAPHQAQKVQAHPDQHDTKDSTHADHADKTPTTKEADQTQPQGVQHDIVHDLHHKKVSVTVLPHRAQHVQAHPDEHGTNHSSHAEHAGKTTSTKEADHAHVGAKTTTSHHAGAAPVHSDLSGKGDAHVAAGTKHTAAVTTAHHADHGVNHIGNAEKTHHVDAGAKHSATPEKSHHGDAGVRHGPNPFEKAHAGVDHRTSGTSPSSHDHERNQSGSPKVTHTESY